MIDEGEDLSNECGGCETLINPPGTPCGPCQDGEYQCTSANSTECIGARELTQFFEDVDGDTFGVGDPQGLCAPNESFRATRAEDCNDNNAAINPAAEEICDHIDSNCNGNDDEGLNACDGCGMLTGNPGDTCGDGTCGEGTLTCNGQQLVCMPDDPDAELNACGGCESLVGELGAACGQCGVYACDGDNAVICNDPGFNDCGTCGPVPQEVCDGNDNDCDGEIDEISNCCQGIACPDFQGWNTTCNTKGYCEYTPPSLQEEFYKAVIYIPTASWFQMGAPEEEPGSTDLERPVHLVTFSHGWFIGKYEVTTVWYEECQNTNSCFVSRSTERANINNWGLNRSSNGRGLHPVNGVSKEAAAEFCQWIGGRLPSEAEWEFAATGEMHYLYPWGNTPATCSHLVMQGCHQGTREVGSKPNGASQIGALDMSGNVWEWVADPLHPNYEGAPADGSTWLTDGDSTRGILRGGAYHQPAITLAKRTDTAVADGPASVDGFRCVFVE